MKSTEIPNSCDHCLEHLEKGGDLRGLSGRGSRAGMVCRRRWVPVWTSEGPGTPLRLYAEYCGSELLHNAGERS